MKASELNHENITDLISAETMIIVEDHEVSATVTGILYGIMKTGSFVYITVGAQTLYLNVDKEVVIHSSYINSQSSEIAALFKKLS